MRRFHARGYSLLELMVAIVAATFLISAVYYASSSSSRTFQEQQRVAQTQLALRAAIEQIRADIARAGFLGTPSSQSDPFVCQPLPNPAIRALRLDDRHGGLPAGLTSINPNLDDPDQIEIVGSFDTAEEFFAQSVDFSSRTITLQTWTLGFKRACPDGPSCSQIFATRSWLRVLNTYGFSQFSEVASATFVPNAAGTPIVTATLTWSAGRPIVQASGARGCGIVGIGTGTRLSVLSGVRYRVGRLVADVAAATDPYARGSAGDNVALKADLIRERFNPLVSNDPGTNQSLPLEYAMEFDVRYMLNLGRRGQPPNMSVLSGAASESAAPESVRALLVRLTVRSRDQEAAWEFIARAAGDPLTRVRLYTDRVGAARARSIAAQIAVPNLIGASIVPP